jgi:hypothetical protein
MPTSVMKMRPVEGGLEIKPGETVTLKPSGLHVMLMDLKHALKQGKMSACGKLTRAYATACPQLAKADAASLSVSGDLLRPAQVSASLNYRFLLALRSSRAGYPRFLSARPIPSRTRSWILQRSWKAVSRNASLTCSGRYRLEWTTSGRGPSAGFLDALIFCAWPSLSLLRAP